MRRQRRLWIGGSALAAALVLSASPAIAATPATTAQATATPATAVPVTAAPATATPATAGPGMAAGSHTAAFAPPQARSFLGPLAAAPRSAGASRAASAGFVDNLLSDDSCVNYSGGTYGSNFWCLATGWFADTYGVHVLGMAWGQGDSSWSGDYPSDALTKNRVTIPTMVSCFSTGAAPTCAMTGLHYRNYRYSAQIVEVSTGGSQFSILTETNPRGATWSEQNGVSCASTTMCLTVGQAGTSKKTRHGVVYSSHATAYLWNGAGLKRLSPPAPAHVRYSELAGVSCATTTSCMAIGNYATASGAWRTYAAAWANGAWQLEHTGNATGERYTTFQSISCVSDTLCVAVGNANQPGSRTFADVWDNGAWSTSPMPARASSGLIGVSCPTATDCVASGWHGDHGLIEAWNGTSWAVQATPSTAAPFKGNGLADVSCAPGNASECVAVGYRFNPRTRPRKRTYRILAELWDGTAWKLMQT